MKKIIKITTIALTLSTTSLLAYSDDYALTEDYRLLNDMKLAQKQQEIIVNINKILEQDKIDIGLLNAYKNRFNRVLSGLLNGNKNLNLKGTKLPIFKTKIEELQKLWEKESKLISEKFQNIDKKEIAISKLNNIMLKTSELVKLYNNSYTRFKQKSKISSIIYRRLNNKKIKIIALNNTKR